MRAIAAKCVGGLALTLLYGCQPTSEPKAEPPPDLAQLQQNVAELQRAVANLSSTLAAQSSDIMTFKFEFEMLHDKTVMIDVSTPEYQCIDTNTGKFLISCDNVQPYAQGQKLTFRIGNPNLVTFSGFKLHAKWGRRAPTYPADNQQPNAVGTWQTATARWRQSLHDKDIESTIELKPGIWNTVQFVVSPATPEELDYLALSMTTDRVSLY